MSKISVVVPIYNVEEYLPRCLDSIVAQTYKDLEIILVDDGSPDNAGAICDEYATKDERIRVFHIPNGGVAKARQLGVESSIGEYIVFVDPDDWLPIDSLTIMYMNMSDSIDIVLGAPMYISQTNNMQPDRIKYKSSDLLDDMLTIRTYPQPWAKLYRKSLFTQHSFPDFKKSQDWLMNIDICTRVRKAKYINNIVYYYFDDRLTSTVNSCRTSIENEIFFIKCCKQILLAENKFYNHKDSFSKFSIHCLSRALISGAKISYSAPYVKEIMADISRSKLSKVEQIKYFAIKNNFAQFLLRVFYLFKSFQNK